MLSILLLFGSNSVPVDCTRGVGFVNGSTIDFGPVETFVEFVGYGRSGHSLVASLLDAHPNALIAKGGDDLFADVQTERYGLALVLNDYFVGLAERAVERHARGEKVAGYSYAVRGAFNGVVRAPLRVVGVERGGGPLMAWRRRWPRVRSRLLELRKRCALRVLFVHVLRHPLDLVATQVRREATRALAANN